MRLGRLTQLGPGCTRQLEAFLRRPGIVIKPVTVEDGEARDVEIVDYH
ncbi:MAG: hypothetical protein KGO02_15165 [Alphaproteobacteria bacterium]|nr:hypothetical protein [Alphaproteobacteria bacterium]